MKRLLILSTLPVLVSGCGLRAGLDVRAYNVCLSRHPEGAVVCEGPRQAYEVDPSIVQAESVDSGPAARYSFEGVSEVPDRPLAPVAKPASSDPSAPLTGSPRNGVELGEEQRPLWTSVLRGFARLAPGR